MSIENVTVAGSGVLGSQIAFQVAHSGFNVTVYDINNEALNDAKYRMATLTQDYERDLQVTPKQLAATLGRMSYETDLAVATQQADLVIEAIPEVIEIKNDFYGKLAKVAPKHTIFATNTSTLLPSQFAEITGRPEKFLALHFANQIWLNNTAEIMKHPGTDDEVFKLIIQFAKDIGMIALPLQKEQPGYILNSLLVPFLEAGQTLFADGIADPATIDKTWMVATKSPRGPFAILDVVGLTTAYNITKTHDTPKSRKLAELLKTEYIDKGKLGVQSGEGFYKYPNPAYLDEDFLK